MGTQQIEVVSSYKTALQDLTFNSKPLINVLTMLAEENTDNGLGIVQVICDRIKEVGIDQKLPSLYLLDSILKNIGGEYVNIISMCIVEIFCHVFESAKDERNRMSLFKLRKTWAQYIPTKTLNELDVRSNKADPNWPIMSSVETSQVNQAQQNKIHVNPKFLQASEITQNVSLTNNVANSKNRQAEEERRLQNEKIQKEREAHEMILKKKQMERERVLADQKRQIDLLKKQQQTMAQTSTSVNTTQQIKKETMKDPRLKMPSPEEKSTGKWGEKISQHTHNMPFKVSPKPAKNKNPASVVSKIMNNFNKKPSKPMKKPSTTHIPKPEKIERPAAKNWDGTYAEADSTRSKNSQVKPPSPIPTEPRKPTASAISETSKASTSEPIPISSTLTAAFSGLSSRDMQIAAQAAAIATAMHQMQSTANGPMAPEQSAQFAAQFIKMMQSSPALSLPTTTVTVTESSTSSSTSKSSTTTTTTVLDKLAIVSLKENKRQSEQLPKKENVDTKLNVNETKSITVKEHSSNNTRSPECKPKPKKDNGITKKNIKNDTKNCKTVESKVPEKSIDSKGKVGTKSKERKDTISEKLEPPPKKSKENVTEPVERPRKARARSPSRYYCQIEQKIDSDKRVEEKEKELSLQRIRKNSEGDSTETDGKKKEQTKIYKQFVGHIEALEKRYKAPKSTISVATLESVFKQIDSKFRRRMMSSEQYDSLMDKLDAFATQIAGKDTKVGKRSSDVYSPNKRPERFPHPPPDPDGPVAFHPRGMPIYPRGPQPFRDGPPHPHRRGPPPTHLQDVPPRHILDAQRPRMERPMPRMMEGPGPHLMDGPPPHRLEGPRPHMMEGPSPHMGEGRPPHVAEGPLPPHMDRPPPHMMEHRRDIPPQRFRNGPPTHFTDRPLPHDGPLPHAGQLPPPHLREGPLPPLHEGPPSHVWERRGGPQWRDSPPPHKVEGRPPREFPRDCPPEQWHGPPQFMDRPPHHHPRIMDGPPIHRGSPNMMERGFEKGPYPEPSINHPGMPGAPIDVNNILGQLMAFGVIKPEEPEIDEPVPEMPLKIESLKTRHRSIIKQLFLGMQCSSCGERFPESQKQQYSDHLDWHFRENKREKEGVRKVSSRSWYYDLDSWIEFSDLRVGKDGKVKSAFFELEKGEYGDIESDLLPKEQAVTFQSVPVEGDGNDGHCVVCMDPLEDYWDEDLEEWRYKDAVREDDKTFHVSCYKDYVPYELEESLTPATTPAADKKSHFNLPEDENPFTEDKLDDSVKKELDEPVVVKTEAESMDVDDDLSSVVVKQEAEEDKDMSKDVGDSSELDNLQLDKETNKEKENEAMETNENIKTTDIEDKNEVEMNSETSNTNGCREENEKTIVNNDETKTDNEQGETKMEDEQDETKIEDELGKTKTENDQVKMKMDDEQDETKTENEQVEMKIDEEPGNTKTENDQVELKMEDEPDETKMEDEQKTDDIKVEQVEEDYMEDNADSPEFPIIMSSNLETLSNIVKSEEHS